jgi:hypothetical protein
MRRKAAGYMGVLGSTVPLSPNRLAAIVKAIDKSNKIDYSSVD